jgi:uncharacterized phage-associated protein
MNFFDSNLSYKLRDSYTNIVSKIINKNTEMLNDLSIDNEYQKILNSVKDEGHASSVNLNINSEKVKNIH